MKKTKGFTLIELLLVLALITVMLGFLVLGLRQHAENARINKAALEIEQVLQAAITYNANNGKWPDDNFAQPCTPSLDSDFVKSYLPNAQVQSSLGYYYCWSARGSKKQLFSVALQVPDNNANFARQLAAHLPNAVITDDPNSDTSKDCVNAEKPCFVRAEVAANVSNTQSAGMLLVGAGNCAKGAEENQVQDRENCEYVRQENQTEIFAISFPACPQNYEAQPKIIVSPNFMTMPGMGMMPSWSLQGYTFMRSQAIANPQSCKISHGQETCEFNLQIQICANANCDALDILNTSQYKGTATVGASYVVACKRTNQNRTKVFF